jgi:hypothetical protein
MRALRLLAAVTCPAVGVSYLAGAPWSAVLGMVAVAGGIAAVIVSRRDRADQRLDRPPSIL